MDAYDNVKFYSHVALWTFVLPDISGGERAEITGPEIEALVALNVVAFAVRVWWRHCQWHRLSRCGRDRGVGTLSGYVNMTWGLPLLQSGVGEQHGSVVFVVCGKGRVRRCRFC